MSYTLRDDVVLEKVSGINLLISLRTAWGECPYILQIASVSAYIWNSIKNGIKKTEIINGLVAERGFSRTKAVEIFDSFVRTAEKLRYIVQEEKEG